MASYRQYVLIDSQHQHEAAYTDGAIQFVVRPTKRTSIRVDARQSVWWAEFTEEALDVLCQPVRNLGKHDRFTCGCLVSI